MDILKEAIKLIINLFEGLFINFTATSFLIGLILFIIGAIIFTIMLYAKVKGRVTTATIIGAIHRTRVKKKIRDGKEVEKVKHDNYLVFEYLDENGNKRKELSSDGLNKNKGYKTGQQIEVIVCPAKGFDDVYVANDPSKLKMATIFVILGFSMMAWTVSTHGMKNTFWLLIAITLITGIYKGYEVIFDNGKGVKGKNLPLPPGKVFSDNEIVPVEDVIKLSN
ncbi:MAG: hypothetical protein ACRBB3_01640 [Alphaproteobacteria bacterium]